MKTTNGAPLKQGVTKEQIETLVYWERFRMLAMSTATLLATLGGIYQSFWFIIAVLVAFTLVAKLYYIPRIKAIRQEIGLNHLLQK